MNKEQQWVAFQILDALHIGCTDNLIRIKVLFIGNPADVLMTAVGSSRISYAVFIEQTVLQNVELKDTDNADDDLFHTSVVFLEDLDGTFLGDLVDTFDELFTLHGIYLTNSWQNAPVRKSGYPQMRISCLDAQTVSPMEKIPGSKTPMISPA